MSNITKPSTGSSPSSSNFVVLTSPEVDFEMSGLTTLFTTNSTKNFVFNSVNLLIDTAAGVGGNTSFNIGWTPPDYLDFTVTDGITNPTPGIYQSIGASGNIPLAPTSTPVIVNVTSPDGGTTLTGRFIITGFYI